MTVTDTPPASRPTWIVDVVMRREPVTGAMSRWQPWRWVLADVVPAPTPAPGEAAPRTVESPMPVEPHGGSAGPEGTQHWLYRGFAVELFPDDAEGYYLNVSSPQPCFWVMWRPAEADDGMPEPMIVTLSYHDAGRWLDAQERVDQVPVPPSVLAWLSDYVAAHYRPEPKRRQRPQSFQPLTDRFGNPVSISTGPRKRQTGGPEHG